MKTFFSSFSGPKKLAHTDTITSGWYGDSNGNFRWWDGNQWGNPVQVLGENFINNKVVTEYSDTTTAQLPADSALVEIRADQRLKSGSDSFDVEAGNITFIGLPVPGAPSGPPPNTGNTILTNTVDTTLEEELPNIDHWQKSKEQLRLNTVGAGILGALLVGALTITGLGILAAAAAGIITGMLGVYLGWKAGKDLRVHYAK